MQINIYLTLFIIGLFNGYNYDSFNPTANNNVNGCNTSNINFDMQQPSFMKS